MKVMPILRDFDDQNATLISKNHCEVGRLSHFTRLIARFVTFYSETTNFSLASAAYQLYFSTL